MEAPNFESIFECISDGVNKVLVLTKQGKVQTKQGKVMPLVKGP